MATRSEEKTGRQISVGGLTDPSDQNARLTEDTTQSIQELEAEIKRLREQIDNSVKAAAVFEVFFTNNISPVAIMDREYNFIQVNENYARADSRKAADFPGHNHFEFYPSAAKEIFDNVVRNKEAFKISARPFTYADHPERGISYWDWTLDPVFDASGEVKLLILKLQDVTENVKAQARLIEKEDLRRTLFNNAYEGLLLIYPDNAAVEANPAACRMFGRTPEEIRAVRLNELVDLADPRYSAAHRERMKSGGFISELTLLRKDGTKFEAEVASKLLEVGRRQISFLSIRDVSERKKAEETLRLSEERFSKAFHKTQTLMAITRQDDGLFIDVNDKYAQTFGYRREELLGKRILDLNIWTNPQDRQAMLQLLAENDYLTDYEVNNRNKSGEFSTLLCTLNTLELDGEKCIFASAIDITVRRKIEEDLRRTKELFYKTFNFNPLPLLIESLESGQIIDINEAFVTESGYAREELLGSKITDFKFWVDLNDRHKYMETFEQAGQVSNYEFKGYLQSGAIRTVLISAVPIMWGNEKCLIASLFDITELRRYQQEITRIDRLNLVGEMAAGFAHEIRNPITTIKGFLQLFREQDRYAQDRERLNLMLEELEAVNAIITEFILLSEDKALEKKRQSLNKRLKHIFPLIQAEAIEQANSVQMELGNIPHVILDSNEINQLILNLARNGLEAMSPGGQLSIKTFRSKDGVVLAVQDQGTGIAPEIMPRIGTPFFTTRADAAGLGLAKCYSIANRHNAKIDFKTDSNGTTFYVRFKV